MDTDKDYTSLEGDDGLGIKIYLAGVNVATVHPVGNYRELASLFKSATALLQACRELYALVCFHELFTEEERQAILERARAAGKLAGCKS